MFQILVALLDISTSDSWFKVSDNIPYPAKIDRRIIQYIDCTVYDDLIHRNCK